SAILFLISDFLDSGYEKEMRIAARKHDLVPIILRDPRELELARVGIIELEDAESGEKVLVDTYDTSLLETFRIRSKNSLSQITQVFKSIGVDYIEIVTGRNYIEPLVAYFKRRTGRL
ncbi:MAG: DUF58 domain-containing protein, partial [bacterium]